MRFARSLLVLLATCCALPAPSSVAGSAITPPPPGRATVAGEPAFEAIGLRQGLASSAIFALTVDRHGFVWFAGDNGLHRYDGQDVRSIDREPGRRDTLISRTNSALAETRDAIWILSFSGLLQRLDAKSGVISHFTLTRAGDSAVPGRGTNLLADIDDHLWVGTDIGLFRFDTATATHVPVPVFGSNDLRITALALGANGRRLFVGSVDGRVARLDPRQPSKVDLLLTTPETLPAPVPLILAEQGGQLWIGSNQGLLRYDFASRRASRDNVPVELTRGRIDALVIARDGTLWLGGAQHVGLMHFDPTSGRNAVYRHHPDDPHSVTSDRISALALDAHDNLWVGLQSGGANRLRISQLGALRYRAADGGSNSFCALREWREGKLGVALCGGSVGLLDPASAGFEARAADLDSALNFPAPALTAHALVDDGAAGYWIPTGNFGLLHWRPDANSATRYPLYSHLGTALPDPYMNDALLDRDGRVWVACSLGLATMAPGTARLTLLDRAAMPGKLLSGGVLKIEQAQDGALWLGSTQGLVRYDPRTQIARRYSHASDAADSLSDNLVVSLHIDRSGTLWAGTQAGLNRAIVAADGELRFRRYGVAEGLPDQTVVAIASNAHGSIWVGTNHGIARLDADRDRFRAFAPGDGVPDSAVNWRAAWTASDGSVYFGSTAGLLRIFPDRLSSAEAQPVMLSSYELAGVMHINLRGRDLPQLTTDYDQARVRFLVAAFGDHRPLAYRMVGLQWNWRDMPANLSVGYDPLPPGNYRFEVRQLGRDGAWSSALLSVPVEVSPPPWRTRGAYAAYLFVALLAMLLLAAAYRRKRARDRRHVLELHRLANFDSLTGLPNRSRFGAELAEALAEDTVPLALYFIDLDRFKNINDSLGHRFGDQVLVAATQRLREALPAAAQLARLGGDEFTVVLPKLLHEREAATIAQAMLDAFANPLRVEGSDVVVTLSIGISMHPVHTRDPVLLVQFADSAMYYAKNSGRNAYRFFQPEMVAQVSRRLALETSLRVAQDGGELYLVFQPQFELASGRICCAEALLRWDSAEHGAVMPAEFIPILEDTGMIEAVGLWVIDRVCKQVRAWREAGVAVPCVAINVSVHQLIRGELCEKLAELLSALALPRNALELEITESALMENAQRMGTALSEFRSLGLGLAIDDFGTGYSSFALLSHLPVSKLKIDKVFIDGLGKSESADTLCAAMIAMAHNLKLSVVAEGVETELQHRRLLAMGCDEAQGYWYCRPLPLDAFEAFLQQHATRPSVV